MFCIFDLCSYNLFGYNCSFFRDSLKSSKHPVKFHLSRFVCEIRWFEIRFLALNIYRKNKIAFYCFVSKDGRFAAFCQFFSNRFAPVNFLLCCLTEFIQFLLFHVKRFGIVSGFNTKTFKYLPVCRIKQLPGIFVKKLKGKAPVRFTLDRGSDVFF